MSANAIRKYMATIGAKGGSATGPTKSRDSAKMRAAALKRWNNNKAARLNGKKGGRPVKRRKV